MVTVNITVTDEAVQPEIYLGRQGETNAREIVFDLSALQTKYGAGTATLYHQRSKDPAPYLIGETTGTTLTWTVSETDTVYAGIGYCEFRYTFGAEGLSKSTMFATNVKASLSGDVIIPAALQAWYDALIEYIDTHSGGSVDPEDIAAAVEDYFVEHPITETDPTVPAWAKAATKPTYTASEVGALPDDTVIPTKTSDLTNDSGFITSAPVASVNGRTGAVTGLEEQTTVVNKTASDTSQTLAANTFYIWPEMSALTITCPATGGPYAFRFTSGATATTLSMTGITMPDDFAVEANKVYEVNVYQGYGLAVSWEVSA